MSKQPATKQEIYSLAQYFAVADSMRECFEMAASTLPTSLPTRHLYVGEAGTDLHVALRYLRMWYATLVPVVEGWKELGLSDPAVDLAIEVLEREQELQSLKRFRNAVFHYQRSYHDARLTELLEIGIAARTPSRIAQLHDAFNLFVRAWREGTDLSDYASWS